MININGVACLTAEDVKAFPTRCINCDEKNDTLIATGQWAGVCKPCLLLVVEDQEQRWGEKI